MFAGMRIDTEQVYIYMHMCTGMAIAVSEYQPCLCSMRTCAIRPQVESRVSPLTLAAVVATKGDWQAIIEHAHRCVRLCVGMCLDVCVCGHAYTWQRPPV